MKKNIKSWIFWKSWLWSVNLSKQLSRAGATRAAKAGFDLVIAAGGDGNQWGLFLDYTA